MKRILLSALILISGATLWSAGKTAELLLVDKKVSVLPISVDKNAPKETMEVVKELAGYIQKISGAKVNVILNDSTNAHEQLGFYVNHATVKISNLKVYTAKAVNKDAPANGGEGVGFE